MNPIVRAEAYVLSRRAGARALLAVSVVIPLAVVAGFLALNGGGESAIQFNGKPLSEIMTFSGSSAAAMALRARNFFIVPLLLLVLCGQTLASERSNHMLREQLLRPVSRARVLWSKLAVVWGLSVVSLLANALLGLGLGGLVLGMGGDWVPVLAGHGAAVITDFSLIVFGFLLASHLRSAVGVIAVGLALLGLDWALRLGLSGLGFLGVELAPVLLSIMPGTGLQFYRVDTNALSSGAVVGLVVWTGLAVALTWRRMQRMDVP
jgi:ABC-type transport system involved in multi-copper enzyme maturation permease subunit